MAQQKRAGQRIGDWFLWIDSEVVQASDYRRIPLVTLRKAVRGGDVISTVVGTKELAAELRSAADQIDRAVDRAAGIEEPDEATPHDPR